MTDFFLKRLVLSVLLAVCLFSLGADDRTEVSKLKMENRRLHAELDRLRKQLTAKDNDLLKFRHFLAATAEAGKVMTASERERQLTDILKEIAQGEQIFRLRIACQCDDQKDQREISHDH